MREFEIGTVELHQEATWLDGYDRATIAVGPDLVRCDIADVTIRIGQNKRLSISDIP